MWRYATGIMERISKSNALYPLLLGFFLSALFACTAIALVDSVLIQVICLMPLILFAWKAVASFDYFMRNNPEMLRTETHVRQMRALEMFGDKDNTLKADADDVVTMISDPALPAAPPPATPNTLEEKHD